VRRPDPAGAVPRECLRPGRPPRRRAPRPGGHWRCRRRRRRGPHPFGTRWIWSERVHGDRLRRAAALVCRPDW